MNSEHSSELANNLSLKPDESCAQAEAPIKDEIDRTDWLRMVDVRVPQVLELRERVDPLARAISFGKHFHPGNPDVKAGLDKNMIMLLILQHLQAKGLVETRKLLEKETRLKSPSISCVNALHETPLVAYIRASLKDCERVFDLSIADKLASDDVFEAGVPPGDEGDEGPSSASQANLLDLEEHLFSIGLLEERTEEEDTNIWLEAQENIIVEVPSQLDTEEGEEIVKAGTLNKVCTALDMPRCAETHAGLQLVERLTSEHKIDMQFVKTFLMTYQSFTTPEKLLDKLMQRYTVPRTFKAGPEAVVAVQLRVCSVLRRWLDEYYGDFANPALLQTLKAFIEQIKRQTSSNGPKLASLLTKTILRKEKVIHIQRLKQVQLACSLPLQVAAKVERVCRERPPEPTVPRNIFSSTLTLYDIDEEEIARQLTLIEFDIYVDIRPSELLNQAWSKPKLKHRSPNVLRMIARFNRVSRWVATSVIKVAKVKGRARVMAKFIRIADHLLRLNNYNSLMAILAGLGFSSVHRLKFTKEEVPVATVKSLSELERLMNSESSFKNYRQRLAASDPPCIPYLGVYLTDLTFIDENPDTVLHNGVSLINFSKRKFVYNVISTVQQFQLCAYNLQPVHQIASFLLHFAELDEQELYHLSMKREPRGTQRSQIV